MKESNIVVVMAFLIVSAFADQIGQGKIRPFRNVVNNQIEVPRHMTPAEMDVAYPDTIYTDLRGVVKNAVHSVTKHIPTVSISVKARG